MELIDTLVKELGVNKQQAEGGTGAIFKLAQEQLTGGDFAKFTSAIPELGKLIKSAPESETGGEEKSPSAGGGLLGVLGGLTGGGGKSGAGGGGGLLDLAGKLASAAGGDSPLGQLGKLAQLTGVFEKLGIDPQMVMKFLPIILAFVQKKGGNSLVDLLQTALGTSAK